MASNPDAALPLPLEEDSSEQEPLQDEIHERLLFYFDHLSRPWKAPMVFRMHVGPLCASTDDVAEIDLCSFIGEKHIHPSLDYAYLDRNEFPYTENTTEKKIQGRTSESAHGHQQSCP